MPTVSPFANLPKDKEQDFRFLLERVYSGLVAKMDVQEGIVKGKIGEHEGKLREMAGAVKALESCPCNKRHDPGETCPLFLLENEVLKNKWRNAGIYTGFFTAGALFYYLAQLGLAVFKGH